jgi:hypothetical protein
MYRKVVPMLLIVGFVTSAVVFGRIVSCSPTVVDDREAAQVIGGSGGTCSYSYVSDPKKHACLSYTSTGKCTSDTDGWSGNGQSGSQYLNSDQSCGGSCGSLQVAKDCNT